MNQRSVRSKSFTSPRSPTDSAIAKIAQELGLSEHTVKKYLFRIFDKLGISSRVELVLCAFSHGGAREAEWVAGARRRVIGFARTFC